jgi:hypothetical protein
MVSSVPTVYLNTSSELKLPRDTKCFEMAMAKAFDRFKEDIEI